MSPVDGRKKQKAPISFWKSILLIIIFTIGMVTLFGLIVYLLISGAERLKLPTVGNVIILAIITGVFAWLVKRLSDTVSDLSQLWFPEDTNEQD